VEQNPRTTYAKNRKQDVKIIMQLKTTNNNGSHRAVFPQFLPFARFCSFLYNFSRNFLSQKTSTKATFKSVF
jgi:hypothetical protein